MGLLDDAIREHLELKRQHGASDEEIAQQESEALGPARRGFPAVQPALDSEEVADTAPEAAELAEVPPGDVLPEGDDIDPTELLVPEDLAPGDEPPRADDEEAEFDEEIPESEREDVLEETPEFLQDAPEHDRLWFEQKPPRDFDFD